jgi:arylsulfatase A-like enzyme
MTTTRRGLAHAWLVLGCAGALACAASRPLGTGSARVSGASQPWNVVLITVDALRADRMSLYGNPRATTPQIDAFAREAAVFENFFAVSAHTSPGIVSLLTGQAPPVHAQTTQFSFYDATIPSPLRLLAERGYDVVGYAVRGATYSNLGFERGQDGAPTEELLAQLAQGEKPFFAWLHTRETHLPYEPAPAHAGKFTRGMSLDSPLLRAVREFTFVLRHALPDFPYRHAGTIAARDADQEPLRALYDECVASADARVGAWLAQLRASGLLERTIVVITADHGEELLDHGWVGHASTGYDAKLTDEIVHIPLIVRVPGAKQAGRYRALASQVDVMPTVFELLGVDGSVLSADQQGVSLAPVLRGERAEVREHVFADTTRKGWTTPREEARQRATMLRTHERKVVTSDWGGVGFFDLRADPAERIDLSEVAAPSAPELEPFVDLLNRAGPVQIVAHISAAGRIVEAAAKRHLVELESARARADVAAVVARWQAIQNLDATWSLERDPFSSGRERTEAWRALRARVADLAAQAIRCDARGRPLTATDCSPAR